MEKELSDKLKNAAVHGGIGAAAGLLAAPIIQSVLGERKTADAYQKTTNDLAILVAAAGATGGAYLGKFISEKKNYEGKPLIMAMGAILLSIVGGTATYLGRQHYAKSLAAKNPTAGPEPAKEDSKYAGTA